MTIALQGSANANATSVTLPSHAINDTVLLFVYRDNSTTSPTIPSDYEVVHQSVMGSFGYLIAAYKVATSASETSGTWTNASHVCAMIFRGDANSLVIPEFFNSTSATSTTVTFGAQPTGSLRTNAENLALVGLVAQRNSANDLSVAPGAMVNILTGGNGSTYQVAAHWDDSRTTSWASTSVTVTNSALYRTQMLNLIQKTYTPSSTAAMFFRPGMNGGMD